MSISILACLCLCLQLFFPIEILTTKKKSAKRIERFYACLVRKKLHILQFQSIRWYNDDYKQLYVYLVHCVKHTTRMVTFSQPIFRLDTLDCFINTIVVCDSTCQKISLYIFIYHRVKRKYLLFSRSISPGYI